MWMHLYLMGFQKNRFPKIFQILSVGRLLNSWVLKVGLGEGNPTSFSVIRLDVDLRKEFGGTIKEVGPQEHFPPKKSTGC